MAESNTTTSNSSGVRTPPSFIDASKNFPNSDPVVIVGMGCRLPGDASSPTKLWDLLTAGRSAQGNIPTDRFNIDAFYDPSKDRPGSLNTAGGYFLNEDIRGFEASFFGINNAEATHMDPQQRKLLEVVYECFESAGATLEGVAGSNTGVYVGNFVLDYMVMQTKDPEYLSRYSATGLGTTILGNRISHAFDLRGPSMVLDTACSSSLYGLHVACTAIENGECDAAVVAGANLITSPEQHFLTQRAGVLSPTSTCHTFDASADGYGRGEGVGALYLKKLSAALRDRDPIRAIVRATAINANGKTPGITQPSPLGQEVVIRKAYYKAGLDFSETSYVECHGTGTAVGDPMEVSALSKVFTPGRSSDKPLLIGAVKTNLGHSEAASGISGVMKAVLALERKIIPPTVGVRNINPKLKLEEWNLEIVTKNRDWPEGGPRRAGVNSFGYGGANAHAIFEAVDTFLPDFNSFLGAAVVPARKRFLLPFSGSNAEALDARVGSLAEAMNEDVSLVDLSYTLGCRRSNLPERGFLITTPETLHEDLVGSTLVRSAERLTALPLAFVFTGQGAQWPLMGQELMAEFPSFRKTIHDLNMVLQSIPDRPEWSLEDLLSDADVSATISEASKSQPACTAMQIGLVLLFREWGFKPAAVVGHSSGEIAAAYATGLLSAPQAILAAYYRGIVVSTLKVSGSMAAVGLSVDDAQKLALEISQRSQVVVACVNSPTSVTISGDVEGVEEVVSRLGDERKFARKLQTNGRAYHSHQMKLVGEQYETRLRAAMELFPDLAKQEESEVRWVSSVTSMEMKTFPDADYWRLNLESPVLFSNAVEVLIAIDKYHLIEIGPHSALELPIKQIRDAIGVSVANAPYTSALNRNKSTVSTVLSLAGDIFLRGHTLNFETINEVSSDGIKARGSVLTDLPNYKWQYDTPLWSEPRCSIEFRNRKHQRHELLGSLVPGGDGLHWKWRNILRITDIPWVDDHRLDGAVIYPGACYLAMAMEAINQFTATVRHSTAYTLEKVEISAALTIPENGQAEVFTNLEPSRISGVSYSKRWFDFEISSFKDGSGVLHARGRIKIGEDAKPAIRAIKTDTKIATGEQWYIAQATVGQTYGLSFRVLKELNECANGHAVASLSLENTQLYPQHPITIDACFQAAIVAGTSWSKEKKAMVPTSIEYCRIQAGASGARCLVLADAAKDGYSATMNSSSIHDAGTGQMCIEMTGLKMATIQSGQQEDNDLSERHPMLRVKWLPDITRFNAEGLSDYINDQAAKDSRAVSPRLRKMLAALDLLVHKNPGMDILELGGSRRQSGVIRKALRENTAWARFASYTVGTLNEDGKVEALDDSEIEAAKKFKVVLLPDDYLAAEHVHNDLEALDDILDSDGYILTSTCVYIRDQLLDHGFETLDLSDGVLVSRRQPAVRPKSLQEVHLVHVFEDSSQPLLKAVRAVLASQGYTVTLRNITGLAKTPLPLKAAVISLVEAETPYLVGLDDATMADFKAVSDNATVIVWVTGPLTPTPEFSVGFGLSRALMVEHPSLRFSMLSTTSDYNEERTAEQIVQTLELSASGNREGRDFEFVQGVCGLVQVSRFVPDESLNQSYREHMGSIKEATPLKDAGIVHLGIKKPRQFDTVHFIEVEDAGLILEGHVEVEVKAVGLNAKDYYALSGIVSTRDNTNTLECAGVVKGIGSGVDDLAVGDRVVVMAPGHFQTVEQFPVWACEKLKDAEPLEVYCTLPLVFSTAIYALKHRAQLQKGEKVLIHSGAGGLGIAAIELALSIGAEVYTTVGTDKKREFLAQRFGIPDDHIFSSRDSSFVEGIFAATGGQGVDVVLNSLTGDLLHDTWKCCAPFARFVEVGKRDILDAGKLEMDVFKGNTTFSAFDLSELYYSGNRTHRKLWKSLIRETLELVRNGTISPIKPLKTFDVEKVVDAFRYFATRDRMGKISISLQNPESTIPKTIPQHSVRFSADKSYILVGCLGGLGRSLSRWMFSRRMRHFVFLARSGASRPEPRKLVEELEAGGATVQIVLGSVVNYEQVQAAVAACTHPIGGVVQGAMGLSEALFTSMTPTAWQNALQPKIKGSWNLHNALLGKDDALDFFLCLSSVSGSVGTATESNYCAANHFLDVFAAYRRSIGKPATSVGLGMISEVGYLHDNPEIEALLLRKGIQPLKEAEFLQVLDRALTDSSPNPHVLTGMEPIALRKLWERGFEISNQIFGESRSLLLSTALNASTAGTFARAQKGVDSDLENALKGDKDAVLEIVKKRFSGLLLVELPKVDVKKALAGYGLDSMIAAEFRTWFYQTFKVDVSFLELLSKSTTLEALAEDVAQKLKGRI